MKRSDMLKVLQESFIYHMNPTGPAESDDEMYSNILKDLEKAGMKPPCCADFGGHRQINANGDCDDYIESCNFAWEPEDGT